MTNPSPTPADCLEAARILLNQAARYNSHSYNDNTNQSFAALGASFAAQARAYIELAREIRHNDNDKETLPTYGTPEVAVSNTYMVAAEVLKELSEHIERDTRLTEEKVEDKVEEPDIILPDIINFDAELDDEYTQGDVFRRFESLAPKGYRISFLEVDVNSYGGETTVNGTFSRI